VSARSSGIAELEFVRVAAGMPGGPGELQPGRVSTRARPGDLDRVDSRNGKILRQLGSAALQQGHVQKCVGSVTDGAAGVDLPPVPFEISPPGGSASVPLVRLEVPVGAVDATKTPWLPLRQNRYRSYRS